MPLSPSQTSIEALGKSSVYGRVRQVVERLRGRLTQRGMLIETPTAAQIAEIVCFRHSEKRKR